jgi:hypothetical protein
MLRSCGRCAGLPGSRLGCLPGHLLAGGFTFHHPSWPAAARDLAAERARGGGQRTPNYGV